MTDGLYLNKLRGFLKEECEDAIETIESGIIRFSTLRPLEKTDRSFLDYLSMYDNSLVKLKNALKGTIFTKYMFIHQKDALDKLRNSDILIVSSGTGTGKTEIFFFYHLLELLRGKKVLTIVIYPTNSLLKDQYGRLAYYKDIYNHIVMPLTKYKIPLVLSLVGARVSISERDLWKLGFWKGIINEKRKEVLNEVNDLVGSDIKGFSYIFLTNPPGFKQNFKSIFEKIWAGALFKDSYESPRDLLLIVIDDLHFYSIRDLLLLIKFIERFVKYGFPKNYKIIILSATLEEIDRLERQLSNIFNTKSVKTVITSTTRKKDEEYLIIKVREERRKRDVFNKILEFFIEEEEKENFISTLVFTNTRYTAEYLYNNLRNLRKDLVNFAATHFGASVEREEAEIEFRSGEKKILFTTRTLEVGVDIGDADRAIYYEIPYSDFDLAQKDGRIGRRVGEGSERCYSIFIISSDWEERVVKTYLEKVRSREKIGMVIDLGLNSVIAREIVRKIGKFEFYQPFTYPEWRKGGINRAFQISRYESWIRDYRKWRKFHKKELSWYDVFWLYLPGMVIRKGNQLYRVAALYSESPKSEENYLICQLRGNEVIIQEVMGKYKQGKINVDNIERYCDYSVLSTLMIFEKKYIFEEKPNLVTGLFKVRLIPEKIYYIRIEKRRKEEKEVTVERVIDSVLIPEEVIIDGRRIRVRERLVWEDYVEGYLFLIKKIVATDNKEKNYRIIRCTHALSHCIIYELYNRLRCRLTDFSEYISFDREGNFLIILLGDYAGMIRDKKDTFKEVLEEVRRKLLKREFDKLIFDNPRCYVSIPRTLSDEDIKLMLEILDEMISSIYVF